MMRPYLVPHASDQHETRIRTRLCRASEGPQRRETLKVLCRSLKHQERAPEKDVEA